MLREVVVATPYEAFAEQLIHAYKFERVYAAHGSLARALPQVVHEQVLIAPVPTITSHIRQRGYDHARVLAKRYAKLCALPYRPFLRRSGQLSQTGKDRATRLNQLEGVFALRGSMPKGAHILLVDDVMTTGATLEQCAKVLHKGGAASISAVVFARAPQT